MLKFKEIKSSEGILPYTIVYQESGLDQSLVTQHIISQIKIRKPSYVAIDIEMHPTNREHLWIGVTDGLHLWIFWLSSDSSWKYDLEALLLARGVIKVFHDFESDWILINNFFKILERPLKILDTQLIAKIKSDPLSLEQLSEIYDVGSKEKISSNHQESWTKRELNDDEFLYLAKDVSITYKLARGICGERAGLNRVKNLDLEREYYGIVNWLANHQGRPAKIPGLLSAIKNNSTLCKSVTGDALNEAAQSMLVLLINNRIVNPDSRGVITYTFSPALEDKAKLQVDITYNCYLCGKGNEKTPNTICNACMLNLKLYNNDCDKCHGIRDFYNFNPVLCANCEVNGILQNCKSCLMLKAIIQHEGFKCGKCFRFRSIQGDDGLIVNTSRHIPTLPGNNKKESKDNDYIIIDNKKYKLIDN